MRIVEAIAIWLMRRRGWIIDPKAHIAHLGGRIFWLNESWSTNGWIFIEPWRSDARDYIQLPPGY